MNYELSNIHYELSIMNYPCFSARRILIVACLLILAGYVLMTGPASTEQAFNPDIFSPRRTVVAPLLCLTGYLLIIVGIMRK